MSSKLENNCSVINQTKGKLPRLPFASMKNAVLGQSYDLCLVFLPKKAMRKLNFTYRGKNKATDILSFPLSKKQGEIFINLMESKKEAKKFGRDFQNFLAFLFIHGLVHLKGFTHGSRMELLEQRYREKFGV